VPTSASQVAEERAHFRRLIHKTYGYETHEGVVDAFHASDATTKIVSCPARTSKSYAAEKDVLPDIFYHGAKAKARGEDGELLYPDIQTLRVWIVAPNYDLAKEFDYFWEDLIERRDALGFDYEVKKAAKSPGQGNMLIHLGWGKNAKGQDVDVIISVRSAANEKTLQSEEVDIAILSEAARLEEQVWTKYLSTRTGRSIWPTTPDTQAMWIYEEIQRAEKDPRLKIEHFQFTPRANPTFKYDRYWVEHQKAEARTRDNPEGLTPQQIASDTTLPADEFSPPDMDNGHNCFDSLVECLAMKDAGFAEQFGGQWTFHRGRVVPMREKISDKGEPAHVIHEDREWFKWCDIHLAFDYGYADPAVVGFWLIGPNQVVLRKSIYERGVTPDVLAQRVKAIISDNNWGGRITRHIGDPKKPEVCQVFRDHGLPIWDMNKKAQADRKAGHFELMNFLATNPLTGEPNMLIHKDNPEIIREWRGLRYKENLRNHDGSESALSGRDDAYDMARYFVMSNPPVDKPSELIRLDRTDFSALRASINNSALKSRRRREATVGRPHSSGLAGAGL
jgi:hypothetical protein